MKLSVLIRALSNRRIKLFLLLEHLYSQIENLNAWNDVEILYEIDNKQITSGAKANKLLERSCGKYIIFIDDDDKVADYYIKELLNAVSSNADCFAINGFYSINEGNNIEWRLSKDNKNIDIKENGNTVLLRRTNHITAVKREIALNAKFPDISNREDKDYSDKLILETEYKIEPPMYWYLYSSKNKEYA